MRMKRFTLIELLVVIAIIAILAGMLLPAGWMKHFFGHCETLLATDTMQVKDYSRCHLGLWDAEAKRQRHETVFPEDCRKAYELDQRLCSVK